MLCGISICDGLTATATMKPTPLKQIQLNAHPTTSRTLLAPVFAVNAPP